MSKHLLIIGAGGHTRVSIECAKLNKHKVIGVIDINYNASNTTEYIDGVKVLGGLDVLRQYSSETTNIFVSIGDNKIRQSITQDFFTGKYNLITLIHPSAIVSKTETKISEGSIICAGVIINPYCSIKSGCIVNTGAIIEHEVQIDSFTHIAPGVKIAGRCTIGSQSFIGIGTNIIDNITIGNHVYIGAGSTITKNIQNGSKVVGVNKYI
jgi:sugar O-acyltransferase (sialic acid O-acetyltransferase NeuD family)